MKYSVVSLGVFVFVAYTEAAAVYPNFVESLHLNPIKFPQDGTPTIVKPTPKPAPKPAYPNFKESLHLNPIKFPQKALPKAPIATTAKPAPSGLGPVKPPSDAKPPIQPRIGLFYDVPIYKYYE